MKAGLLNQWGGRSFDVSWVDLHASYWRGYAEVTVIVCGVGFWVGVGRDA